MPGEVNLTGESDTAGASLVAANEEMVTEDRTSSLSHSVVV